MCRNLSIEYVSRKFFGLILIAYLSISFLLPNLSLRQSAILIGIPLLILFFLILLQKSLSGFRVYKCLKPIYLYLLFLSIPTIAGFLNKNDPVYLIGDLWQVFFVLLVIIIVVELVRNNTDIERLFSFTVLFCSLDIIVYFIKVAAHGYFRNWSLSSMILTIMCFSLLIYSRRNNKRFYVLFLLLSLAHLLLTQTRTYWLGTIVGLFLLVIFSNYRILFQLKTLGILASILLLSVTYLLTVPKTRLANTEFDCVYIFQQRMKALEEERLIRGGSFKGRIFEAREIISEYNNFSILKKLIGTGLGAIYKNPRREYDPTASDHFIHVIYVDILFYQGITGLILFLAVMVHAIVKGYKNQTQLNGVVDQDINKLCIILVLVFLFISVGASYIWGNLFFAIFVGIIYAYQKTNFKSQKTYSYAYRN